MLRRSQSAVNTTMLRKAGLHPPPTHPPPPPPLGQLVKVDISRSKSDYATVGQAPSTPESMPASPVIQSSFRPTDCAKLYASPEEIKAVGYRSPDMMAALNRKNNGVKTRSQSLPPSTSRPSVQRGSPEKDSSLDSGIYSTTYSTFRGTENEGTRTQEAPSSVSSQTAPVSDAVTYARPKNNKSVHDLNDTSSANKAYTGPGSVASPVPDIPEPDYSSDEDHTYNSQDDSQSKKTRTLKKKKQSVAFSQNLVTTAESSDIPPYEASDIPHYAAPAKNPTPLSSNFKEMIAQKVAERQARQDDGTEGTRSATSSPNKKVNGSNGNGISDVIQDSTSFNKQKEKTVPTGTKVRPVPSVQRDDSKSKMKNSHSCPSEFLEDGDNSSSGVSSDQDVHPESNYVTVINTESDTISANNSERFGSHGSRDDSSEASESSDEASDRTWILTNEKGDRSDSGKDSDSNGSRRTGTLTRNAVSLVKLPPPQETTEPDIETELTVIDTELEVGQECIMSRSVDQDTISTLSSLSSLSSGSGSTGERDRQQLLHNVPVSMSAQMRSTLPRLSSSTSGSRASCTPPVSQAIKATVGGSLNRSRSASRDQHWGTDGDLHPFREKSAPPTSRSSTSDRSIYKKSTNVDTGEAEYERSIEESLQLIRMHMDSLNEVNSLAGVSLPEQAGAGGEMVLAPPPEFCDMSLGEPQNRKNKTVIHISSDDYDLPGNAIGSRHRDEDEMPGFRRKTLTEWTTRDTTEWLESIFMPEYKDSFEEQDIDGRKLMGINNDTLINLGVRRVGHRVNMEKSLKRYKPTERIDL
ncbi:hypothetical protein OTU49_005292 [Cherax quadricarinatus]|uniref:SAM domain-containing protein n=4 Tax=Cherax quadricarinatus TaxID=27406 RepID=A0AAW0X7R0_CHEQU